MKLEPQEYVNKVIQGDCLEVMKFFLIQSSNSKI